MKRIILVRHAKSDKDNYYDTDFDRWLSKRWIEEIKFVSKILKKLELKTDLILCSSAVRARETLEWLWEELDVINEKVIYDRWIYDYHMSETLDYYIDLISKVDDKNETIVLVWHNPFITKLSRFLTWNQNLWVETLWISIIDFDIENWGKIWNSNWNLSFFISPKYLID